MIPYDRSIEPPFVAVDCVVANPVSGKREQRRGKLDTGADMTFIPESLVSPLGLVEKDRIPMGGFVQEHDVELPKFPSYLVNLSLNGFDFEWCEVCACRRDNILIGRDVLNQLNLFLYGQALEFNLQRP
jgi:hypothetical protein